MISRKFSVNVSASVFFLFFPVLVLANFAISEVMYDVSNEVGADDTREWIELYNSGPDSVDLTGFKINDGSNHLLNEPPKNGGKGAFTIGAGEYVIFADNASVFLSLYPVSVSVIDTTFSLNNMSEAISLLGADGAITDSISYTNELGAAGNGNSLQKANGVWSEGRPTPGAANYQAPSQNTSDNSSNASSGLNSSQNNASSSAGQTTEVPQISADAGEDKTVLVGADSVFSGRAFGTKNESLKNARFIWNMGDGASKEGQTIKHNYKHPGEYIVVLNVSSNELSATDRITVTASPADFSISRIESGAIGFIEIENQSNFPADLSGWFLNAGGKFFLLPTGTIIDAGKKRIFPAETTGLILEDASRPALLYPNGSISAEFEKVPPPAGPGVSLPKTTTASGNDFVASAVSVKTAPAAAQSRSDDGDNGEGEETDASGLVAAALAPNSSDSGNIFKWLFFLSVIIILALGAYFSAFAMKADSVHKSDEGAEEEMIKAEAGKYKIIEEPDE